MPESKVTIMKMSRKELSDPKLLAEFDDPYCLTRLSEHRHRFLADNPLGRTDDDPAALFGLRGKLVMGRILLMRSEIVVDGRSFPVLLPSSWGTPPEFRQSGVALKLLIKIQSMCPTLVVCGLSQMSLPICRMLRWREFSMNRYIFLRRSRSVVERYFGRIPGKWPTSKILDAGLLGLRLNMGIRRAAGVRGLVLERREVATEELDAQITLCRRGRAHMHRSSAWLNWLLQHPPSDDPRNKQELYRIYGPDDSLAAYFLVKVRFYPVATHRKFRNLTIGSLQDWGIFDSQAVSFRGIVLKAVGVLVRHGVDAVEVCVPMAGDSRYLRGLGFVRVGELNFMFKASAESPLAAKEFHGREVWDVRPADGDNYFT